MMNFFDFKIIFCIVTTFLTFGQARPELKCVGDGYVYENGILNTDLFCCHNADGKVEFCNVTEGEKCCRATVLECVNDMHLIENGKLNTELYCCHNADGKVEICNATEGAKCCREPKCVGDMQVYKNGELNLALFCCHNAYGKVEFGNATKGEKCCRGASKSVFNERDSECRLAQVVAKGSQNSEAVFWLKKESAWKDKQERKCSIVLNGTLLVLATPNTSGLKAIKIENFEIKLSWCNGFNKLKKGKWFAVYTREILDSNSVKLQLNDKRKLVKLRGQMAKAQGRILDKLNQS